MLDQIRVPPLYFSLIFYRYTFSDINNVFSDSYGDTVNYDDFYCDAKCTKLGKGGDPNPKSN